MAGSPRYSRNVSVRPADLDQLGRLRLEAVIRWCEETEYAFLRSRGLSVSMRDRRGQYGFPRLKTSVEICGSVVAFQPITVAMELREWSPKTLLYTFQVQTGAAIGVEADVPLARVTYEAACCRFPPHRLPYPILIPDEVLAKLTET